MAKRSSSRYHGRPPRSRLAEDQDARPAGVRDLRLHEGPGPARGTLRLARPRRPRAARSASGSGTSAPASASGRSPSCSRSSSRCGARRVAVRRSSRRCRRSARATSSGSSRSSSARSSSPSGRTTATCARRRSRACATTSRRGRAPRAPRGGEEEQGVKLSNLDKLFWPEDDRAADHEGRPDRLLPRGRAGARAAPEGPAVHDAALSRRRVRQGVLPEGRAEAHARVDPALPRRRSRRASGRRKQRWIDAPVVNDARALLWMANMGCIDMNAWYSRVDKPERPDFVLFDLDPSPDVGFEEVVQVALLVKQALDALGLVSFPKTSSADGMHVLVPIERRVRRTRRRASSARSSPARSRARTAASRRRSGRRRSGAACSSTRTRTARGRRSPRSTPCGRGPALRSRRRCAGTR